MPKKSDIIDEKDRQILSELDKNARQADSEIAKKVRLSKQVVNLRIKNLVNRGIITDFYTIVNTGNLGLNTYYIFLQLEKINHKEEISLINSINSLDYVGWLVSGIGRWDIILNVNVGSVFNLEKYLNHIVSLCGKSLHEYMFTTLISAEHLGYRFLSKSISINSAYQGEKQGIFKIDLTDEKILRVLANDARLAITEISEKTKLPLHVVNYRIKNLIKKGIIETFRPKINVNLLGYEWHLLLIQFQNINEERKKEFIVYCKSHKNIYYITNTIGNYNLMLDIHVRNVNEFKEVIVEMKDKFSDVIRLYESVIIFDEYKISYIPKGIVTKALLFDLDGTLVNTEKLDEKIFKKIFKIYGIQPAKKFSGYSLDEYMKEMVKDPKLQKRIKQEFLMNYEKVLKSVQLEINKELLRYLRVGEDPRIALVTANNRKLTEEILAKTNLSKYFNIIITSEDCKNQKPHPDPYLKAIKELNVNPQDCIAFEDSEIGITSAKAAKIAVVRKVTYT